jgi:hypothetical protein
MLSTIDRVCGTQHYIGLLRQRRRGIRVDAPIRLTLSGRSDRIAADKGFEQSLEEDFREHHC